MHLNPFNKECDNFFEKGFSRKKKALILKIKLVLTGLDRIFFSVIFIVKDQFQTFTVNFLFTLSGQFVIASIIGKKILENSYLPVFISTNVNVDIIQRY